MPFGINNPDEFASFVAWFNEGRSLAQSERADAGLSAGAPATWVAAAANLKSRGINSLKQPTAKQLSRLSV